MANKKSLSGRDICSNNITPAIIGAGWNLYSQIREDMSFTNGRGKLRRWGTKTHRLHHLLQVEYSACSNRSKEKQPQVGTGMLEALLEKYADTFCGKAGFKQGVEELEDTLYFIGAGK